jgi:hypothetical protein
VRWRSSAAPAVGGDDRDQRTRAAAVVAARRERASRLAAPTSGVVQRSSLLPGHATSRRCCGGSENNTGKRLVRRTLVVSGGACEQRLTPLRPPASFPPGVGHPHQLTIAFCRRGRCGRVCHPLARVSQARQAAMEAFTRSSGHQMNLAPSANDTSKRAPVASREDHDCATC